MKFVACKELILNYFLLSPTKIATNAITHKINFYLMGLVNQTEYNCICMDELNSQNCMDELNSQNCMEELNSQNRMDELNSQKLHG